MEGLFQLPTRLLSQNLPLEATPEIVLYFLLTIAGVAAVVGYAFRHSRRRQTEAQVAQASLAQLELARDSERRYRNLLESLGHLIFLADRNGHLVHFNGRWENYIGIQPTVDGSFHWRRLIHSDDARPLVEAWARAVKARAPFKAQFRLRRFDGSFRWQMAQANPAFDSHGNLSQWIGSVTEIEEQHQANELFQSIFRQAPVVMAFFRGPRFRCEQATPLARQLFGNSIDSGRPLRETFPELEGQGLLEWMEHVYRTGEPFHGTEYPALLRSANGDTDIAYINLVLQPTRNAEQRVDGVMVLGADVTELVRARNRLQLGEAKLRRLIDSNIIGIFFFDDTTGELIDANEAFLQMTGHTHEDLRMGRLSRGTLAPPEYGVAHDRCSRQLRQQGKSDPFETEFVRRDGTRVPALMAAAVFEGGREGVAWVLDLSERRRTERELQLHRERLDLVVDSMKVGVWYSDVPFTRLKCNETLREHYWLAENEEASVTSCYSRLSDEDRQRVEEAVRRCIFQNVDYDVTYKVNNPHAGEQGPRGTPEYRWIRAVGKSYRAANGCAMRFDGVTLDVTSQIEAERELHRALRVRDEFISVASHELRTPLTSMKLQIQAGKRLLDKDTERAVPERVRRIIDQSDRQILRLTRLIDDMLDISRIHTGRLSIRREAVDLGSLVREVLERLAPQIEHAGCDTRLEIHGEIWLDADRYRLEQVLTNILTNACRHGAGRPIEIRLDKVEDQARLSITDHGGGIALCDQERIFHRYERATPPSESSGLGIGLFISQQIAQMHGGNIEVDSRPGEGATFTVTVPALASAPCLARKSELAHAH